MSRESIKISIVTPSYNQGEYISETFDSILKQQGNFSLQYIVVDALSTDRTRKVVEEYTPKFKNVGIEFIFICEKDAGQSDAINKGWKIANGDIVTYINSDDYYEDGVLQKIAEYFKHNQNIMWAYGGWNFVDKKRNLFKAIQPKIYKWQSLLNYCNIVQPSVFFKRELLDEVGLLSEKFHLAMDYDLWLRFGKKYPAGIIDGILSNTRFHDDAKTVKLAHKQNFEAYGICSKYSYAISFKRLSQVSFLFLKILYCLIKIDTPSRIRRFSEKYI